MGLDCDPRQLAYLTDKANVPILGHAYDLSMFIDNSFEVVFSVGCLMHLPSPIHPSVEHTWQMAVAEMARVSRRYVILGEYWAEEEEPVEGKHWEGCLWRRPYDVPGFSLLKRESIEPFDTDVLFTVWKTKTIL